MSSLPSQRELMKPTIQAVRELGGSATIEEIYEKIVDNLNLSDAVVEIVDGKTGQSKLEYNLGWVRTMLKNQGVLKNEGRGRSMGFNEQSGGN